MAHELLLFTLLALLTNTALPVPFEPVLLHRGAIPGVVELGLCSSGRLVRGSRWSRRSPPVPRVGAPHGVRRSTDRHDRPRVLHVDRGVGGDAPSVLGRPRLAPASARVSRSIRARRRARSHSALLAHDSDLALARAAGMGERRAPRRGHSDGGGSARAPAAQTVEARSSPVGTDRIDQSHLPPVGNNNYLRAASTRTS